MNSTGTYTQKRTVTGWVVALTAIGSLMAALDTLVVSTSLSTIRLDLGASIEDLEWTVNAYNLSFAVLLIPAAALGDRYGRRKLYAGGLGLFAAASAACALAPEVGWLVAARAIQGAGAALVLTLGLALLSAAFPPEKRGTAIGLFSAVTGISVAIGPLVGGAIVEGIDWEWIFWLNVPIGLAAIPFVLTRIEESYGGDTGLDLPGLALISAAAFGIVWGLVRGNTAGWDSLEVIGALAAGLLLVAAFIARERRAPEPMLPLRFFRSRGFSAGNGAIFLTFASLFGAVFFFAQMLQTALGYGPLDAGLRLMPWTITFITVAPVVGSLVDRFGERPFMVGGLSLQAIGMGWVALIADPGLTYSQFVPPSIVAGVGVSMAIPAAQNSVVGSFSLEEVGKAAGANSMMRELGGVFGIAVAAAVFAGAGSFASADSFLDGFAPAVAVLAAFSLAGAVVALGLPGRRQAEELAHLGAAPALEPIVEADAEQRGSPPNRPHRRRNAQPPGYYQIDTIASRVCQKKYDGDQYRHGAVKQPGRRPGMAVIVIQEFEATTDQYDQVNEKLGGEVPDGLIAHAGAESGNGKMKVVDIWESKERWESFLNGRLGPAVVEVMGPPPEGAQPPVRGPRGA